MTRNGDQERSKRGSGASAGRASQVFIINLGDDDVRLNSIFKHEQYHNHLKARAGQAQPGSQVKRLQYPTWALPEDAGKKLLLLGEDAKGTAAAHEPLGPGALVLLMQPGRAYLQRLERQELVAQGKQQEQHRQRRGRERREAQGEEQDDEQEEEEEAKRAQMDCEGETGGEGEQDGVPGAKEQSAKGAPRTSKEARDGQNSNEAAGDGQDAPLASRMSAAEWARRYGALQVVVGVARVRADTQPEDGVARKRDRAVRPNRGRCAELFLDAGIAKDADKSLLYLVEFEDVVPVALPLLQLGYDLGRLTRSIPKQLHTMCLTRKALKPRYQPAFDHYVAAAERLLRSARIHGEKNESPSAAQPLPRIPPHPGGGYERFTGRYPNGLRDWVLKHLADDDRCKRPMLKAALGADAERPAAAAAAAAGGGSGGSDAKAAGRRRRASGSSGSDAAASGDAVASPPSPQGPDAATSSDAAAAGDAIDPPIRSSKRMRQVAGALPRSGEGNGLRSGCSEGTGSGDSQADGDGAGAADSDGGASGDGSVGTRVPSSGGATDTEDAGGADAGAASGGSPAECQPTAGKTGDAGRGDAKAASRKRRHAGKDAEEKRAARERPRTRRKKAAAAAVAAAEVECIDLLTDSEGEQEAAAGGAGTTGGEQGNEQSAREAAKDEPGADIGGPGPQPPGAAGPAATRRGSGIDASAAHAAGDSDCAGGGTGCGVSRPSEERGSEEAGGEAGEEEARTPLAPVRTRPAPRGDSPKAGKSYKSASPRTPAAAAAAAAAHDRPSSPRARPPAADTKSPVPEAVELAPPVAPDLRAATLQLEETSTDSAGRHATPLAAPSLVTTADPGSAAAAARTATAAGIATAAAAAVATTAAGGGAVQDGVAPPTGLVAAAEGAVEARGQAPPAGMERDLSQLRHMPESMQSMGCISSRGAELLQRVGDGLKLKDYGLYYFTPDGRGGLNPVPAAVDPADAATKTALKAIKRWVRKGRAPADHTLVRRVTDPCHPVFLNPWTRDTAWPHVQVLATGARGKPFLGLYTGAVMTGSEEEGLASSDATGATSLEASYGMYLPYAALEQEAVVVVGDRMRSKMACVNSADMWGSCAALKGVRNEPCSCAHRAASPPTQNVRFVHFLLKLRQPIQLPAYVPPRVRNAPAPRDDAIPCPPAGTGSEADAAAGRDAAAAAAGGAALPQEVPAAVRQVANGGVGVVRTAAPAAAPAAAPRPAPAVQTWYLPLIAVVATEDIPDGAEWLAEPAYGSNDYYKVVAANYEQFYYVSDLTASKAAAEAQVRQLEAQLASLRQQLQREQRQQQREQRERLHQREQQQEQQADHMALQHSPAHSSRRATDADERGASAASAGPAAAVVANGGDVAGPSVAIVAKAQDPAAPPAAMELATAADPEAMALLAPLARDLSSTLQAKRREAAAARERAAAAEADTAAVRAAADAAAASAAQRERLLAAERDEAHHKLAAQGTELDMLRQRRTQLTGSVRHLTAEVAQGKAALAAQRAAAEAQEEEARTRAVALEGELRRLGSELRAVRSSRAEQRAAAEREAEALRGRIATLTAELDRTRAAAEAQQATAAGEAAELRQRITGLEERVQALTADRDAARTALAAREAANAALQREGTDLRAKVTATILERDAARQQLATQLEAAGRLNARISSLEAAQAEERRQREAAEAAVRRLEGELAAARAEAAGERQGRQAAERQRDRLRERAERLAAAARDMLE